jgi:hypothetical protein
MHIFFKTVSHTSILNSGHSLGPKFFVEKNDPTVLVSHTQQCMACIANYPRKPDVQNTLYWGGHTCNLVAVRLIPSYAH